MQEKCHSHQVNIDWTWNESHVVSFIEIDADFIKLVIVAISCRVENVGKKQWNRAFTCQKLTTIFSISFHIMLPGNILPKLETIFF